jgi:hypothetical protein
VNEPLSHGFIRYRIKPNSNLVLNDQIRNSAAIYFDFNAPVITNTAITTVLLPTAVAQITASNKTLSVYPNPAMDEITFSHPLLANSHSTLRIYDLTGRMVMEKKIEPSVKNSVTLNFSTLTKSMYLAELEINGVKHRGRFVKGE